MRISDWSSDVCSSDLEFGAAHIDFAAHFGDFWIRRVETMWNIGNRLRVQRDIFTDLAGAACCGRNQLAILIAKAEREAVDLGLCRDDKPVCRSFSKQPANALQKFLDIFGAERVLEAEHWQGVDDFAEGRRQVGADLLSGRSEETTSELQSLKRI